MRQTGIAEGAGRDEEAMTAPTPAVERAPGPEPEWTDGLVAEITYNNPDNTDLGGNDQ